MMRTKEEFDRLNKILSGCVFSCPREHAEAKESLDFFNAALAAAANMGFGALLLRSDAAMATLMLQNMERQNECLKRYFDAGSIESMIQAISAMQMQVLSCDDFCAWAQGRPSRLAKMLDELESMQQRIHIDRVIDLMDW